MKIVIDIDESCEDCISRELIIKKCNEWIMNGNYPKTAEFVIYELVDYISGLPSIQSKQKDSENRLKGTWMFDRHHGRKYRVCSKCGIEKENDYTNEWNFCPNCGADMREVEE